jgi:KDO2-lipid IV(A) lauroyltransferase
LLANSTIEGQEWLLAGKAAGKGVIAALPHLGNWEAAGLEAARQGVPVTAVAEVLPDPRIVEWFTRRRATFGIEIVLASKGVSTLIETRLRQGGTVALVADRDLKRKGIPVIFFGEQTTLPAGPLLFAMRTGAMLLPAGTYFTKRGHHNVVLPPLEIPVEGDNASRLAAAAQLLANRFEDVIRKAPTDWHLFQPNWPSDFSQP